MDFKDAKLVDHPLVEKAFHLANKWHSGQNRGTSFPFAQEYIHHPVLVAEILQSTGKVYNPTTIAAALTHDLIEDTNITLEELEATIGPEAAKIVSEVSVPRDVERKDRHSYQLASIFHSSEEAKELKIADRAANLISLAFDPPEARTLKNKAEYIQASKNMLDNICVDNSPLTEFANNALAIASRALRLGVIKRAEEKGYESDSKAWREYPSIVHEMLFQAKCDAENQFFAKDAQRYSNIETLYAEAAYAQREIKWTLQALQSFSGHEVVIPEKLKDPQRSKDVIEARFDGDARHITDIARGAIICKRADDIPFVLYMVGNTYEIVRMVDRFQNPLDTGYRDMQLVLRSDNGHLFELQIHLENFWRAKQFKGDTLYKDIRAIGAQKDRDGELTPDQKRKKDLLMRASKDLYNPCGEAHGMEKRKPFLWYQGPVYSDRKPFIPAGLPDGILAQMGGTART